MNKMQIRAEVFASINNILADKKDFTIQKAIGSLNEIEDKEFLSKLLIKEFINTNDTERTSIISLLLLNCVPIEDLEKNLWSNLTLKTVSDEKKYQLIEILKSLGKFIEYDKYLDYFEEPQKIIDMDTHKLLSSAMLNPETQIDFLDFMETLLPEDKKLLIQSMAEDYTKDDLANIISPIILYENNEEIIETVIEELIKSKSPLAYYPLKRFSELTNNEYLSRIVQKSLKELQLAGINEQKAKEYYTKKFNNSLLCSCYSSLPDGKGNQALIFTRIRSDNSIQLFCVVINDVLGVKDCFGFNTISQMELSLILKKFAGKNDPFITTFETGLNWLYEAEKITFDTNNKLPYEYVCWREILFDINPQTFDNKEIISKALEILPQKECDFDEIFKTDYLDKLFLTKQDNNLFADFINELDNDIYNMNEINLSQVEDKIKQNISLIFDEKLNELFVNRLNKIAFILMSNSKHNLASQVYNITKQKDKLNELFAEIIKKSIFVNYEEEFQQLFNANQDNIFLKNAKNSTTKLDYKKLQTLLEQILNEWGQDE